ncbi:MAG TPA: class I SAM-dependent methyltransferase [Gemmatimonadaceae bacterium]
MDQQVIKNVVTAAVAVAAVIVVTRQCRKPASLPGRLFLWLMNRSHRGVTRWGLEHVALESDSTILDVGCGGGMTVRTLAGLAPSGTVYGIDCSKESVAASRRLNADLIAAGRVDVRQGTVSHLPYPDATFDVVTAVETHYYWPSPVEDMRQILRVLKPGGRLLVIAETYKGRSLDWLYSPAMTLLQARYLTAAEHEDLLTTAGYGAVEIVEDRKHGWICCLGTRPAERGAPVRAHIQGSSADGP